MSQRSGSRLPGVRVITDCPVQLRPPRVCLLPIGQLSIDEQLALAIEHTLTTCSQFRSASCCKFSMLFLGGSRRGDGVVRGVTSGSLRKLLLLCGLLTAGSSRRIPSSLQ